MNLKKSIVMLMIITLLTAGVNIVASLDYASDALTSFPWWSVIVLSMYYFGPVLLLEGLALLVIHVWERRQKIRNKEEG